MKVFVTGGNGFIGRYLIRAMLHEGWTVGQSSSDITASLLPADECPGCYDAVVHLAALLMINQHQPEDYFRVNSYGTFNVLEFCRVNKIKKFVYAMTHSDQNRSPNAVLNEDEENNVFGANSFEAGHNSIPFIASKIAAMKMVEAYDRQGIVQGISLRLSNIRGYGSADTKYNSPFHQFISKAMKGEDIEIWGNPPKTFRDIIYIKDVCSAIIAALKSDCHGVYNIGSGNPYTIEEEVVNIINVFSPPDKRSKIIYRPDIAEVRNHDCIFDSEKAQKDFYWAPCYSYYRMLEDFKKEMEEDLIGKNIDIRC
jgi:UDP-glucose 4-epimerase